MIDAALSDLDLVRTPVQPPDMPGSVPTSTITLQGEGGTDVVIRIMLGRDRIEAGDLLQASHTGWRSVSTGTLRLLYESGTPPESFTSGPCRSDAAWEADDGCVWQERRAPAVGDDALALQSDALEGTALAAVMFAREHVIMDIEVRQLAETPPNDLTGDIAEALDEQIKQALSR